MRELIFQGFLDKITVAIDVKGNLIYRDLRDRPWSDEIKYYGKMAAPWFSGKIDCSDYEKEDYWGCKAEIRLAMYFLPENDDWELDKFPQGVPVMACEVVLNGAYPKAFLINGQNYMTFKPGTKENAKAFWYRLDTNEVYFP